MLVVLRVAAAAALTLALFLAGLSHGSRYLARHRQLRELRAALRVLETEVVYGRTPLGEACGRLGQLDLGAGALLLAAVARGLKATGSARQSWLDGLAEAGRELSLDAEDFRVLGSLGSCLGQSDAQDQAAHLAMVREMLLEREKHAAEEARRNGRLWSYLGALSGLGLALLLL